MYACIYCGKEHDSPNGTGTDILCCGELGHSSLCGTCEKADKSCQIWEPGHFTQSCVEYKQEK